jgi:hypothetical protein
MSTSRAVIWKRICISHKPFLFGSAEFVLCRMGGLPVMISIGILVGNDEAKLSGKGNPARIVYEGMYELQASSVVVEFGRRGVRCPVDGLAPAYAFGRKRDTEGSGCKK